MRSLILIKLNIKSFFHKLRFDLINECVVAICSLVLFATFFYIFNDFLNDKINSISSSMRSKISCVSSLICILICSYLNSSFIKQEHLSISSFTRFCFFIGESFKVTRWFLIIRNLSFTVISYGVCWWIIYRYLFRFEIWQAAFLQLFALMLNFVFIHYTRSSSKKVRNYDYSKCHSMISSMVRFRLNSILRSWYCILFLTLGFISICFSSYFIIIKAPLILPMFLSFLSGFFVCIVGFIQCKQDLDSIWIDRMIGVSEDDFFKTYKILSSLITLVISIPIFITLIWMIVSASLNQSYLISDISSTLKVTLILFVTPMVMPNLIFQIDAKRPMIQILIAFITGLFISTAIWAHWLSVILIPLMNYYGRLSQHSRFYRV